MFWSCDECREWGVADTEVDAAVDRLNHAREAHRGAAPPPAAEEEPSQDTVLARKWIAWGALALLGLLSARFPSLAGVLPCAALIAFVVTYMG